MYGKANFTFHYNTALLSVREGATVSGTVIWDVLSDIPELCETTLSAALMGYLSVTQRISNYLQIPGAQKHHFVYHSC